MPGKDIEQGCSGKFGSCGQLPTLRQALIPRTAMFSVLSLHFISSKLWVFISNSSGKEMRKSRENVHNGFSFSVLREFQC
jgi:hypothetical protein